MTKHEAYALLRANREMGIEDFQERLYAHSEVLKFGAVELGETARQKLMAGALSDMAFALAELLK